MMSFHITILYRDLTAEHIVEYIRAILELTSGNVRRKSPNIAIKIHSPNDNRTVNLKKIKLNREQT